MLLDTLVKLGWNVARELSKVQAALVKFDTNTETAKCLVGVSPLYSSGLVLAY